MSKFDTEYFSQILRYTRQYFIFEYKAGTREMVYRYVASKLGDVEPRLVTAALRILKDEAGIVFEKRVWWNVGVR